MTCFPNSKSYYGLKAMKFTGDLIKEILDMKPVIFKGDVYSLPNISDISKQKGL